MEYASHSQKEYLKEFKIMLMIGGECYDSNFALAFNSKEAKEKGREMFSPTKGQTISVRSLGMAIDPQTHKRISRPKQND